MCSKFSKWPPCICIGAHPRTRVAFPRQAWTPSPSQRASTCTQTAPLHASRTACSQHTHANRTGTRRPHRVRRATCGGPSACITTRVACRPRLLPRRFLAAPSTEENGGEGRKWGSVGHPLCVALTFKVFPARVQGLGGAWATTDPYLRYVRPTFRVCPTHI